MPTKNLGQIAAIIFSSTAPSNNYILWFDLSSNSIKYFNFATSTWDSLSGASNIGQIKLNSSDTIGYLIDKLDSSLKVSGGQLGVTVPVTTAEKAKWNGQTTTFFVATHTDLSSLTPSTGDRGIVADDGAGVRAGYYWSGATWLKDFDPQWENINLHWSNIVDVPDGTTSIKGVLNLALDSDITTGTNTTKSVTPKQLVDKATAVQSAASSDATSKANTAQSNAQSYADGLKKSFIREQDGTTYDIVFTQSGSWENWDVSSIVPVGITFIVLSILVETTNAPDAWDIEFRRNSSAPGTFSNYRMAGLAALSSNISQMLIPVDSDRTLQYNVTTGTTGGAIRGIVCGWLF